MKKILIVLMLLVLCACQKDEPIIDTSGYEIVSDRVDMSSYYGVNSIDHKFRLVTCKELFNTIDNKGSGVFYLGRSNCNCCQDVTKYLNEVAKELDVTIYYIDVYNPNDDLASSKELQDELLKYLHDICAEDDEGNKALFTPHLFQVINGELGDSQICHDGIFVSDPTEKDIQNLKKVYTRILKPFSIDK